MASELNKGFWQDNPVFIKLLGLCPALAVTNSTINGLALGATTFFVLVGTSFLVSLLRRWIPKQVRITTFIIIIATFVTMADLSLQALAPAIHKELGAFIALIVVNCLILGRQEAFASRNPLKPALADAMGMAGGFALALFMIGAVREILGSGSFLGFSLFGPNFEPWVIMILPPGGFLTMGVMLMLFAFLRKRRDRQDLIQLESERRAA
ncbi:MAG TPA: electron transport complex subunit RsxE [Acidobacteriota bacterium]|nr:electron transport complex subunit RsxE [Acidobacteriota bacterium]